MDRVKRLHERGEWERHAVVEFDRQRTSPSQLTSCLLADGKTPYERRFGEPFKGPIIPFGAMVEYHPISAREQSRLRQFGQNVLPGIFLGYALIAEGIWKGDILVAHLEELE